jgi:5-methylcytosine-specific restriction endonuclease McrA
MSNKKRSGKSVLSLLWASVKTSDQYRKFKAAVRKRDGYKCTECGSGRNRKNPLHVHHIARKCQHLDKIFDVDNGILLCRDHHIAEHRRMKAEGIDSETPHATEKELQKLVGDLTFKYRSKRRSYRSKKTKSRKHH